MPLTERDDADFGGSVLTVTRPDGPDALPEALRRDLPAALVAAFEDPAGRLAGAAEAVGLPGFAGFCERLAALPVALEAATGSLAYDDDVRLVFGTYEAAEATPESPAAPPDFSDLDAALPEGALTPEMKAEMQALGARMQHAFAAQGRPVDGASAAAPALSFVPPPVLDVPPLVQHVYDAIGTVRLGPPGASAGLVAAQPADYRLDAADPDLLAVFETGAGDLLATNEDGTAAAWLLADDAGETPVPAGTLATALDAVFAALARGEMPAPPTPDAG